MKMTFTKHFFLVNDDTHLFCHNEKYNQVSQLTLLRASIYYFIIRFPFVNTYQNINICERG